MSAVIMNPKYLTDDTDRDDADFAHLDVIRRTNE